MRRWIAVAALMLATSVGALAAEDAWVVGRWRADLPDGGKHELVLGADGRFVESRVEAAASASGSSRSSASSASSRSGSWSLDGDTLVLRAGGESRRTVTPIGDARKPQRMRLDDVEYERVES